MNPRHQIRVRLVQMDVRPGRPSDNTARIIEHVRRAGAEGVDLVVFPEMAVPGYLLGDEWEHDAFLRECERCGDDIRLASEGVVAVFGTNATAYYISSYGVLAADYNALYLNEGALAGLMPRSTPWPDEYFSVAGWAAGMLVGGGVGVVEGGRWPGPGRAVSGRAVYR